MRHMVILIHSFLSPISNKRDDEYGGSYEGRIKLLKNIIIAIRKDIPEELPIFLQNISHRWTSKWLDYSGLCRVS